MGLPIVGVGVSLTLYSLDTFPATGLPLPLLIWGLCLVLLQLFMPSLVDMPKRPVLFLWVVESLYLREREGGKRM